MVETKSTEYGVTIAVLPNCTCQDEVNQQV